jgi:hypothetical protein
MSLVVQSTCFSTLVMHRLQHRHGSRATHLPQFQRLGAKAHKAHWREDAHSTPSVAQTRTKSHEKESIKLSQQGSCAVHLVGTQPQPHDGHSWEVRLDGAWIRHSCSKVRPTWATPGPAMPSNTCRESWSNNMYNDWRERAPFKPVVSHGTTVADLDALGIIDWPGRGIGLHQHVSRGDARRRIRVTITKVYSCGML